MENIYEHKLLSFATFSKHYLGLGHFDKHICFHQTHSIVALVVCLESLSCCKDSQYFVASYRFSSNISLNLAPSVFPSTLTSFPVLAEEKYPLFMMLPPLCFTVWMVGSWLCSLCVFRHIAFCMYVR
ncbi:hypothetical protein ATANTOWER_006578 [Ataeniobius toweri]|uniref:Uncharacterized protein n=1 Tax=Ataeniobius toweri TaxID=208326 RepID=A0ABU7AZ30_9TELE|nr:hypothetical protein [Ataeniobius toweri]